MAPMIPCSAFQRFPGDQPCIHHSPEMALVRPGPVDGLDGDGQHDPADLQRFLDYLKAHPDTDFLIGSRFQDRAKIPAKRWRTNALGTWTLGRIAGVTWEDSQSGFRLIRKKVLDRLQLRSTGFAIEMEIAMKAADWKLRWAHIPIQAIYRPGPHKSHFRGVMDTWLIAWESLKC